MRLLTRSTVLGILGEDRSAYFSPEMVDVVFQAERVKTPIFKEIFVAIDPASHNSSSMGMCAIGIHDGIVYLMGLASVRLERADVLQINKTIVHFLEELRKHPAAKNSVMLPIIEVNGKSRNQLLSLTVSNHNAFR